MPKWLSVPVIFALAGVLTNVLIAWACAYFIVDRTFDATLLGRLRDEAFESDQQTYLAFVFAGFGGQTLVIHENGDVIHRHSAGWPCHSMVGEQRDSRSTLPPRRYWWSVKCNRSHTLVFPPLIRGGAGAAGAPMFAPRRTDALLPMRPLMAGFAINSLMWAAALAGVWAISGLIKRTYRRLRHRCPGCGYPIGGSALCSECGRRLNHGTSDADATLSP